VITREDIIYKQVCSCTSCCKSEPNNEGLVQAMSQVILKEGEIKGIKGRIKKLKLEMQEKYEIMAQFKKDNEDLHERIDKLKITLRQKGMWQGGNHIIWESVDVEAPKFIVYLNFINDNDPGGYRWPPTFSNWLKIVFWQF
jgi:hypothetical protein